MVKGVGHLGHGEAMEARGREFSLHGRVVKEVGHIGRDEATEAGGREFAPRPGHYSRMSFQSNRQLVPFSHPNVPFFQILNLF